MAMMCLAAPPLHAQEAATEPHPLLRTVDRIARITPATRGLALRENVPTDVMDRPALEDLMQKMLREEYPPEMIELTEKAYKALDLIAPDEDIIESFSAFATSQVAAFYEPKTKRIYILDDLREMMIEMMPGEGGAAMAEAMIDPMITNTLAHEFTHALQDQHFDLEGLLEASQHDDDMALAVHALVEGDAMIAGTAVMLGDTAMALDMAPDAAAMNAMGAGLAPGLGAAPAIFRETLLFPYIDGWVFALHVAQGAGEAGANGEDAATGFTAIDRAFRDPPISTEQVLHPEKYAAREAPLAVDLPDLDDIITERLVGANTMGELQTRILLGSSPDAMRAAEGWGGDTYAVFEAEEGTKVQRRQDTEGGAGPDGDADEEGDADLLDRLRFIWVTVWDTEADAGEFAIEYAAHSRRRARARIGEYPDIERASADGARTWRIPTRPGEVLIEHRATRVAIVEGFPPEHATRILEALREASIAPKTLKLEPEPAEIATP